MFGNAVKPTHLLILLIIIVLLFGAKKLPDLAKSVGQSLKIFKKEMKELTEDDDKPAPTVQVVTPEQGAATPPVTPVDVTANPPRTPSGSTTPPQA
ncbi:MULTISPECIES: Sec-independent protein translocase subunit TatA [Sanguibacter]|mgnify:CR=1 FL=1|jgi:sec-independent protein translocase protein TatA|uniref:Sec-independent protein translocase protein TatA n=1 Tax=Sanguibacter inulinus TaxID=60922 RepID=A0A853EPV3_9MICO|nr:MULTISPECIES: Sec-independent protein translocase subunit TatA [Sanguibacter]KQT98244.1 preprotein translocase subunit TatA [Sanguibacter sp. Leaf3]MBF0721500.1 Sec-independent protein translocase subunit TatA [Sanguibacter inulinus]NYS92645.1 Sec-independent protein translocase subunit TatA [Sanguibacter inulinus]